MLPTSSEASWSPTRFRLKCDIDNATIGAVPWISLQAPPWQPRGRLDPQFGLGCSYCTFDPLGPSPSPAFPHSLGLHLLACSSISSSPSAEICAPRDSRHAFLSFFPIFVLAHFCTRLPDCDRPAAPTNFIGTQVRAFHHASIIVRLRYPRDCFRSLCLLRIQSLVRYGDLHYLLQYRPAVLWSFQDMLRSPVWEYRSDGYVRRTRRSSPMSEFHRRPTANVPNLSCSMPRERR